MKNVHGRTCKKTKVYIYLYISLYENLFENGCIYIYIYIYIWFVKFKRDISRCLSKQMLQHMFTDINRGYGNT